MSPDRNQCLVAHRPRNLLLMMDLHWSGKLLPSRFNAFMPRIMLNVNCIGRGLRLQIHNNKIKLGKQPFLTSSVLAKYLISIGKILDTTKDLITELSCMQKFNISPWHPSQCSCDNLQPSTASTSSTALIDVVFLAGITASTIGCSHTPQPDNDDLVRHVHAHAHAHAPCFLWLFVWRENHPSGAVKS